MCNEIRNITIMERNRLKELYFLKCLIKHLNAKEIFHNEIAY